VSTPPAELETAIDGLYQLPLDDFTPARNRLAQQLKQQGQTVDAERVRTLRKPPLSAWVVNQLWWHERDRFVALLEVGGRIRREPLAPTAELKQRERSRRQHLHGLLEAVASILATAGKATTKGLERRIQTTLEACSARSQSDPEPGRLAEDLDPPSFDVWAVPSNQAPTDSDATDPDGASRPSGDWVRARRDLVALRGRATAAARAVELATSAVESADEQTRMLEQDAERARSLAVRAQQEAVSAAGRVAASAEAAERARQTLLDARRDLATAEGEVSQQEEACARLAAESPAD